MSDKKEGVEIKEGSKSNSKETVKTDELAVLKNIQKDEPKKAFKPIRKIRVDLVIFGVLIYILGIFTGLFVGVGISQGDLSLTSFQKFFSSENQIQVQDVGNNQTGITVNHGIVINNAAGGKSSGGIVGGGSGSGDSSGGSSGGSSVTYVGDTPVTGGENKGPISGGDSENYPVVDTTPKAD